MPNSVDTWEKTRRFLNANLILIAIIIFAFGIRVYFFRNNQLERSNDSYVLAKLASGIPFGKYEYDGTFWAPVQPMYPFLISIVNLMVGDLFLSGKIISLFASVGTIPIIYLLWTKLESKEVAILTAGLVAINEVAWYYSIHVFRDMLFLFFVSLSFLLLFMAREDFKWLLLLMLALGLSTLTRGEGYYLTLSIIITFCYWNREYISGKKNLIKRDLNYSILSIIFYIFLTLPWHLYRSINSPGIIPEYVSREVGEYGHVGLRWIYPIINLVSIPIILISLGGILLSYREKDKYLPLYLFIVFFSIPHMWYHAAFVRYALPLLPLILGWASITLIAIINRLPREITKLKIVFLFLILLFFFSQSFRMVDEKETKPEPFEVVKDTMLWFEANTKEDSRIVGGDDAIYGYYTPKHDTPNRYLNMYTDIYLKLGSLDLNVYYQQPYIPVIAFMIEKDIHYLIAYDSITPLLFDNTKPLKDDFRFHQFILKNKIVTLSSLKRFEKNDQTIYIYQVDWEEM